MLLQRRADDGQWGAVGGLMELGETPQETTRREVREEVGLELGELRLLGTFSGPEAFHIYPNGDQVFGLSIVHAARFPGGPLLLDPAEVLEAGWFGLDELPDNLRASVRCYVRMYRAERGLPGCMICHA